MQGLYEKYVGRGLAIGGHPYPTTIEAPSPLTSTKENHQKGTGQCCQSLYGWWDSNPHARRRKILSLVRKPVPPHPLGRRRGVEPPKVLYKNTCNNRSPTSEALYLVYQRAACPSSTSFNRTGSPSELCPGQPIS